MKSFLIASVASLALMGSVSNASAFELFGLTITPHNNAAQYEQCWNVKGNWENYAKTNCPSQQRGANKVGHTVKEMAKPTKPRDPGQPVPRGNGVKTKTNN